MNKLKNITRIAYKRDPEKGERGAIPRVSTWQPDKTYYAGAEGETFVDFVYFDGLYYRCLQIHSSLSSVTPYVSVTHKDGLWDVESNFELVATKVAFVGEGGSGWIIDGGRIYHSSGAVELSADGEIKAGPNSEFKVSPQGVLEAKAGTFDGYVRTRFTNLLYSDATQGTFETNNGSQNVGVRGFQPKENLSLIVTGGADIILPSDEKYIGSVVTIYANNYPPYTRTGIALLGEGVTVHCGLRGPFLRQYAVETLEEAFNIEFNPDSYPAEYSVNWVAGIKRFLGVPHHYQNGTQWMVYDH